MKVVFGRKLPGLRKVKVGGVKRKKEIDRMLPALPKIEPASEPAGGGLSELRKAAGMSERECRAANLLKVNYARIEATTVVAGTPDTRPVVLWYGNELISKQVRPATPNYDYVNKTWSMSQSNVTEETKRLEFNWGSLSTGPYFGCSFRALTGLSGWGNEFKEAIGVKDILCEVAVERLKKAKGITMMVATDSTEGWNQKEVLARLVKHGFNDVVQAPSTHNLGARNMTGSRGEKDYAVHLLVGDWREEE